jgi:transposase
LNGNDTEHPAPRKTYTQDDINKLIGYIIDDKMTIKAASKKANIPYSTAQRFFLRHLKEHLDISTSKYKQDKINELIGYIVDENMSIKAASKKANMSVETGRKYYWQYLKEHSLDVPMPIRYTQE